MEQLARATSASYHPTGPDVRGPANPIGVSTAVAETKGLMQLEDSARALIFSRSASIFILKGLLLFF